MRATASLLLIFAAGLATATPALADVKAGVEAWTRGDYSTAIRVWQTAADKGDADAQFNLAQAYRMGRGVPENKDKAEYLYSRAAAQGHLQAADNYGLLLFQDDRREAALPYVKAAAERGDPRAQYLLGIAHFNGDLVGKDWVRAYALMTLASQQGLPQAATALQQMDGYIPMEQRQTAASVATTLHQQAQETRARQLAAADLGTGNGSGTGKPADPRAALTIPTATASGATPRIPGRIERAPIAPSAAATGQESPADAGADFVQPAVAPKPAAAKPVAPKLASPKPALAAAAAPASGGKWKLQLGAFSVRANAEKLWSQIGGKGALAGKTRILAPAGSLTKLYAGGFASERDAAAACDTLKRGGQGCLISQ